MRPGSIWQRAAGLVLLVVVFMPAPVWAGDYTLTWRDGAWVERRADCPEYKRLRFWRAPACIEGDADDSLEDYEPPEGKDWPDYLLKLYLPDINDAGLVAVYRYTGGGYMSRLSGPAFGEWHENYTATREARIAEAIAAALAYEGLDPEACRILAGVIKPDADMVQYGVVEARFPHEDPGTDRIRLTIGERLNQDGYSGWGAVWLVEIRLWRPHRAGSPYVIESVTLSGLAG